MGVVVGRRSTVEPVLRRARLENARAVLSSSDRSVTEVGQTSGFNDLSAFIRAFRSAYGETPKQFQLRSQAG